MLYVPNRLNVWTLRWRLLQLTITATQMDLDRRKAYRDGEGGVVKTVRVRLVCIYQNEEESL